MTSLAAKHDARPKRPRGSPLENVAPLSTLPLVQLIQPADDDPRAILALRFVRYNNNNHPWIRIIIHWGFGRIPLYHITYIPFSHSYCDGVSPDKVLVLPYSLPDAL